MQLPTNLPYDRWLDYLFGHPVGPSGFRESDDWWDEQEDPSLAVAYLTRLFEAPDVLLDQYPHDQVDRGLWFLAGDSGHLQPLLGPPVLWEARRRGLLAIANLYARLFLPACTNHLGHIDRGPEPPAPLNSICYMWWDLFPSWGSRGSGAGRPPTTRRRSARARRQGRARPSTTALDDGATSIETVDEAILTVMARTLDLDSEPCREGALHGLGHWHRAHPERTTAIIDGWLGGGPRISEQLRQYAISARGGCVL